MLHLTLCTQFVFSTSLESFTHSNFLPCPPALPLDPPGPMARDVRRMVSEQLASGKCRKLALHRGASALKFHQTLQELESLAFDLEFDESLKGVALPSSLQRNLSTWLSQVVLNTWLLLMISIRAWSMCRGQPIFRTWHLGIGATRAARASLCQAVFKA